MRHADDEEGEQERAGEEGGCEAGARVERGVRGHIGAVVVVVVEARESREE